jgi:hypothetical protein
LNSMETSELLELEKQFWDAMKRKDGAAAERLTAEECIVVGPQGVSAINRAMMSSITAEGQWTLQDFELDEGSLQVRMLADGMAGVAYKVIEHLLVEGQVLSLEANDASVWLREYGEWKCAIHTETLSGDPFGRDRKA